jgi:hypothetical protein
MINRRGVDPGAVSACATVRFHVKDGLGHCIAASPQKNRQNSKTEAFHDFSLHCARPPQSTINL